jgi:hypothetical protein
MESGEFEKTCQDAIRNDPSIQDYDEYLKSPLWRKIRRRVLKRDNHKCKRCSGKATVVHHRDYTPEVLRGDADHLLVSLCDGCHHVIEFDELERKRSFAEKELTLSLPFTPVQMPIPIPTGRGTGRRKIVEPPCNPKRMSAFEKDLWNKLALQVATKNKCAFQFLK